MEAGLFDLLQALGGGVFRADPGTLEARFASDGLAALTGHPLARWLASPPLFPELLHPDDRGPVLGACRAVAAGARVLEHRLLTADGRTLFCRTALHVRPDELTAIVLDAGDLRRAEARARESDARLLALVDNLPFDFWICDPDGRYTMGNSSVRRVAPDLVGRRPDDLDDFDPATRALWVENNRRALAGEVVRGEVEFPRAGRQGVFFNVLAPIRDGDEIRGVVGFNIDVTDLKQAERDRDRLLIEEQRAREAAEAAERRAAQLVEELRRSLEELQRAQEALVRRERLAALGELASVVAHEVRNPLGTIFNSLGALRKMVRAEGEAALLFEILDEEARRLNRIVVGLLDWVRPLQPTLQGLAIGPLLDGALRAAQRAVPAAEATIEVMIFIEPGLPPVLVDDQLLHLALVNLFVNALQAMPRGGRLTVQVRREKRDGHDRALLIVSDTGPGISPEVVGRVFQPFFTTRATGTGLGLAVVKRIIESHGGTVDVASAWGSGATFAIRLRLITEVG
jgi:PAS domain S-box-containing protein